MKADFPNANLQLWPGQFVNARVLVNTMSQVVVIPTPAVQRGPNGTFAYVVQDDDRVALRPITLALQNEKDGRGTRRASAAAERDRHDRLCAPEGWQPALPVQRARGPAGRAQWHGRRMPPSE